MEIASTFLTNNQALFIDSSSTSLKLADYVSELNNIQIITNGLHLAQKLNLLENVNLFFAGGHLPHGSNSTASVHTFEFIENFSCDLAFISCRSINTTNAYDANMEQAMIKKAMINKADKTILLVDHTKFGKKNFIDLISLDLIDTIITDKKISDEFLIIKLS